MPKWMQKWMITCGEATDWISRKEEGKLSLSQWLRLRLHFIICIYCLLFYRQNKTLTRSVRHAYKHMEDVVLTPEEKQAMADRLKSLE
jgi:hypothetical protein